MEFDVYLTLNNRVHTLLANKKYEYWTTCIFHFYLIPLKQMFVKYC